MTTGILVLVCITVFVGALAQRSTGMGFALVAAPFLVLLLGPLHGVVLVNLASVLSAGLVLLRVRRDIEWRRYLWLVVPALVGIVPGSFLAVALSASWLEFAVGAALLVALGATLLIRRGRWSVNGRLPRVLAGFVSGVTNSAAGIGGPPVSIYAVISGWPQQAFAATVQPYFMTIGIVSVATKLVFDPARWPVFEWWIWLAVALALVGGVAGGELVARRLRPGAARWAVLVIAIIGSAIVTWSGLSGLLSAALDSGSAA